MLHLPHAIHRRPRSLAVYALLGLSLTVATFGPASGAHAANNKVTLTIGYFAQVHDAALLNLGAFLPHTYTLQYVKFLRYTDAEIALNKDQLNFSSMGYSNAILDASAGRSAEMKLVEGMGRGAVDLVCHKGVIVKKWADLKGKTVGQLPGGTAQVFLDDALASHGIVPGDLHTVDFTAPGPPLLEALKGGTVQCFAAYEPFTAQAVSQGFAYYPPTPLTQDSFNGINNALAVNSQFASANKHVVQTVVTALQKSTKALQANRSRWISVATAKLGFPRSVVSTALKHTTLDWHLSRDAVYTLAISIDRLHIASLPSRRAINAFIDTSYLRVASSHKR